MRADRLWRTRKQKKEWARRLQSNGQHTGPVATKSPRV
jgi:hypothetical protein